LATEEGEQFGRLRTLLRKQPIGGRPIVELLAAGGQQAGDGVAPQTYQGA
jgi:hypothetical protein